MAQEFNERHDERELPLVSEPRAQMDGESETPATGVPNDGGVARNDSHETGRAAQERPRGRVTRPRRTREPSRRPRRSPANAAASAPAEGEETPVASTPEPEGELQALTAQGFTREEAQRLVHISDRLATSHEAREAEAAIRRLRFTRWLVEHGMLNEFSA